ncbi:DUF742 domain-containing protein [Catellatospora chokoriensis]|uniref:DUF742 domain-containing protein n=1 Tax=Catellatospora chokoriensis TaxID=310353 RepID=A0A8J3JUC0_9ACTN|nr:DUF742 domain-containing protein [Catellatospora chokoriensis]GIF87166.1 hypothetical protein Cch02nite_06100 [Catellatospora chokoriensis]
MRADDDDAHEWLDAEAGPLVRSYAVTGGRARPGAGTFDLLTYVVATPVGQRRHAVHLQPEHRALLALAHEPISVAELSSRAGFALGVVRVLLADLLDEGAVKRLAPAVAPGHIPDDHILQAVILGLRHA